jgi:hypothetical protein
MKNNLIKMEGRIRNIILIVSLILFSSTLLAQENIIFEGNRYKLGFIIGYGAQNMDQAIDQLSESNQTKIRDWMLGKGLDPINIGLDVPYDYQVYYYQMQYYYTISNSRTTSTEFLFQPQYNETKYQPILGEPGEDIETIHGYEVGVSLSLVFRKNLFSNNISLYLGFGGGPHWVSGTPQVQADGFIFSLTGFAGLNVKLVDNLYLDFRPAFTHISNAGLKHPNKGLNDLVLSGGFYFTY